MKKFGHYLYLALSLAVAAWVGPTTGCRASELRSPKLNRASDAKEYDNQQLFDYLEELSRIVDITYCIPFPGVEKPFHCAGRCNEFEGFELVESWNTGALLSDSTGYLALSHPPRESRIILAFRGTYSLSNVVADLSVAPQTYVPSIGDGEYIGPRCENCTVHEGFMKSWLNGREAIITKLEETIQKYPGYQLTLGGHSLGGAVAALAGVELHLRGWKPHVVTFGQPRLGNKNFSDFIDGLFQLMEGPKDAGFSDSAEKDVNFYRVTHVNDPIPLLPPEEWDYAPHAGEIFITKDKLPFNSSDLRYCTGNLDRSCSAGHKGAAVSQSLMSRTLASSDLVDEEDKDSLRVRLLKDSVQAPMLGRKPTIPPRYRLWELFWSHRDYFHRLGTCIPGFDYIWPSRPNNETMEAGV